MKKIQYLLLFAITIYCNSSISDTINPTLDISTPITLTSSIEVIADFGIPGDRVLLNSAVLDLSFSNNLLSDGETFGLHWLVDPALRRFRHLTLVRGTSKDTLSYTNLSNLYIDDNGLAYFNIFVTGGNGVKLTGINLSTSATIQAVPVPSSLLLFVSGLFILTRKACTTKLNT